jgi:hypothetical protein
VTGIASDNLYHVVTMQPGAEGALLDGITIRDGLANGGTVDLQRGSGLNNLGNLTTHQVVVQACSIPPVYNSPGALLTASQALEIRQ